MGKKVIQTSKQELKRVAAKTPIKAKIPIQKIPKLTRLSKRTVERLRKKGSKRKKGSGREETLNKSQKMSIRNKIEHNLFLTPADLVDQLELPCSDETARNYLHRIGLSYKNVFGKELLTEDQMNERVKWCEAMRDFDNFDKVIFTDETGYWLEDIKQKGWFPKTRTYTPAEIESSGKLNIWASISMAGKVDIHIFEENFNAILYEDILRDVLVPSARELYPEGCYLQRDSKVHRANNITNYLNSRGAEIILDSIPWPSYSPDLNPIENLWAILKANIKKRLPKALEELKDIIMKEWDNLNDDYVRNLCFSIHNRIEMCIKNKGARIDY